MAAKVPCARAEDVHALAMGMPHVTVVHGNSGNPVYQVGRKSFVFFRTPRLDAVDPATGERYTDVIVFWVESESDKQAMLAAMSRAAVVVTDRYSGIFKLDRVRPAMIADGLAGRALHQSPATRQATPTLP